MTGPDPQDAAQRAAWELKLLPEARAELGFTRTYDAADFARIRRGFTPQQMEDKWLIYYDDPWLWVHRSWSRFCIFRVRFEPGEAGFTAVESWVNRDPDQYKTTGLEFDRAVLRFLIERLILERPVRFPVDGELTSGSPDALMHYHFFGSASFGSNFGIPMPRPTLWSRIRAWWWRR